MKPVFTKIFLELISDYLSDRLFIALSIKSLLFCSFTFNIFTPSYDFRK